MTRIADQDIVWGSYERLSRLKSASRRRQRQRGRYRNPDESVERQRRLIRGHADERGLDLLAELMFRDNGRSAWEGKDNRGRDGWDAMLAAGKAGKFGGLLVWKLDRFARNIRDGEDLIDLGVLVDGPDTGRIDLRTAHGKSVFRKQIESATHASNETSEKVRAAFADMLASGYRVGGSGRLFGFEILSLAELDAAAIRRRRRSRRRRARADRTGRRGPRDRSRDRARAGPAAARRRDHASARRRPQRARHHDHARRSVERAQPVRTLGNPLYGGWLAYKGEIKTRLAGVEPIMDADTFDAVQAKLGARKRGRRQTGKYPLSGVLVCGNPACSRRGTMAGYPRSGGGAPTSARQPTADAGSPCSPIRSRRACATTCSPSWPTPSG